MKTVAITGSIGSGKSTVTSYIAERYYTQSCDAINSELIENSETVREAFSDCYTDGKLDRKKMAQMIFHDVKAKEKLEGIMHPLILEEIRRNLLDHAEDAFCFVEVPLLFEAGWEAYFDLSLLVVCDEEILLQRLMEYRHMQKEDALSRLRSQMSLKEKAEKADHIIFNNGTLDDLYAQIEEFLCILEDNSTIINE